MNSSACPAATAVPAGTPRPGPDYGWPSFLPFITLHVLCLAAFWTGARAIDWIACASLYFVGMFAVTAGYHRYFAHRSFRTSRWFQCLLAFFAEATLQRGVLWWAAHHRAHHKYTDTPTDLHSPAHHGFWHAHVLWLAVRGAGATDLTRVRDLAQFPELVWLDRHWRVPPLVVATGIWLALGWSGLIVGYVLGTVLVLHATFTVNSLAHVIGTRRFATGDTSRNNWWIALLTLGEGWHNNHHRHMGSTRQGFYWWEVDVTFYVLRCLGWLGIVRDLRPVPPAVLAEGRLLDARRAGAVV